ncbi:hypothetical protein Pcinc_013268 [Petrolisthes cinctipes]|uniref:Uncharacterized protein n=1 Tax=Petrolisthes cinctipes TaxID=88211 RepID=A0AAE1FZH3_PETCI|nr:hypothetical protein Pcinc_013268 [Petrolisthes cinctipes]
MDKYRLEEEEGDGVIDVVLYALVGISELGGREYSGLQALLLTLLRDLMLEGGSQPPPALERILARATRIHRRLQRRRQREILRQQRSSLQGDVVDSFFIVDPHRTTTQAPHSILDNTPYVPLTVPETPVDVPFVDPQRTTTQAFTTTHRITHDPHAALRNTAYSPSFLVPGNTAVDGPLIQTDDPLDTITRQNIPRSTLTPPLLSPSPSPSISITSTLPLPSPPQVSTTSTPISAPLASTASTLPLSPPPAIFTTSALPPPPPGTVEDNRSTSGSPTSITPHYLPPPQSQSGVGGPDISTLASLLQHQQLQHQFSRQLLPQQLPPRLSRQNPRPRLWCPNLYLHLGTRNEE